ncbi:LacI family transcriptional regulator [Echinicola pacifica]|uniref:LacI family transcriptional regulator n=1 Tax=Echinicola pacifica TaxID=346377 RepID=A0A918UPK2_9BACT|nr:LacI family DNA-binding transcriptional regulator [Echinicola pacifica]GGZ24934.1 LacI family transcriptional regulator [Echinicola pacifica]
MKEYITIKDLAGKLGLSIGTVSKAFNPNYSDISVSTRNRILKTARELGYVPNPFARKLLKKQTLNIGIIVPEFLHSYFSEVIFSAQEAFLQQGYQTLIMSSNEDSDLEMENIKTLMNHMVDGLIISVTKTSKNHEFLNNIIQSGLPVVQFNRVSDLVDAPKVIFNDYKWAVFATEHLIEQGCRNLVHLGLSKHIPLGKQRILGFRKAMDKHQLPYSEDQIVEAGITIADGEAAMTRLLDRGIIPDGIMAAGDPLAIGAMKILKRHDIHIPSQVKVIGFTESALAKVVEPELSSISQPTSKIGKLISQILLDQIAGKPMEKSVHLIDGKLNIRESSTGLPIQ